MFEIHKCLQGNTEIGAFCMYYTISLQVSSLGSIVHLGLTSFFNHATIALKENSQRDRMALTLCGPSTRAPSAVFLQKQSTKRITYFIYQYKTNHIGNPL